MSMALARLCTAAAWRRTAAATHSLALAWQGLESRGKRVERICIGMALTGRVVQRSAMALNRSAKELRRVVLFSLAKAMT